MEISLKNIHSLTEFKRNANVYVEQIRSSHTPLVLTINGEATVIVQDAESFQATIDQLRNVEAELKALKLSQLRQDLQIGITQIESGQSINHTADTVHQLFDEIKLQGRSELGIDQ